MTAKNAVRSPGFRVCDCLLGNPWSEPLPARSQRIKHFCEMQASRFHFLNTQVQVADKPVYKGIVFKDESVELVPVNSKVPNSAGFPQVFLIYGDSYELSLIHI